MSQDVVLLAKDNWGGGGGNPVFQSKSIWKQAVEPRSWEGGPQASSVSTSVVLATVGEAGEVPHLPPKDLSEVT